MPICHSKINANICCYYIEAISKLSENNDEKM